MRPKSYFILVTLISVLGFVAYLSWVSFPGIRAFIKECSAAGYSDEYYLASCSIKEFGDYEHGAFYFETEPTAVANLKAADILFFGNSRMQHALSNQKFKTFFSSQWTNVRPYLFGFGYAEPYRFSLDLFKKFALKPKVVVVAVDGRLFEPHVSDVYRQILTNQKQRQMNYAGKSVQQTIHKWFCLLSPCAGGKTVFRSRLDGTWNVDHLMQSQNVEFTITDQMDVKDVEKFESAAKQFVATLKMPKECVFFISVPFPWWNPKTTVELAARVGVQSIEHELGSKWMTIDKSHLTTSEGERFTEHILEKLKAASRQCFN